MKLSKSRGQERSSKHYVRSLYPFLVLPLQLVYTGTNLKLAIDFGLQHSQSDLIPSYLQTLIMSEGDKWVENSISSVALALRAGVEGKPVATANNAVRSFATRELSKAEAIAALED